MQLYFIRHAQSANNRLYEETGSWNGRDSDPELTELGRQQARRLAEHVACATDDLPSRDYVNRGKFGLTHLYSSLMVRALATASYLSAVLNLPLVAWEDWHEIGGIFMIDEETGEHLGQSGKTRSELAARFPQAQLPETLGESGWWNRAHESADLQVRRARRVVYDLIERHGGTADRVAVISHGGFYNYVLAELLGIQADNGFWFSLNNTGITRFNFEAEGITLAYANWLEHLPTELIT
ncbi:MAG TPA: histidine phosphatase family protein [Anaerolineae bacterium]|nr:histidine phosphatase family protein [Anaerolineae bacterium]